MPMVRWGDMNTDGDFPLFDAGMYLVEVKDLEKTKTKSGTPQVMVKGVIAEGQLQGTSVVDYIQLMDTTMWKVGSFLVKAGMSAEELKALPDCDTGSEAFWRIISSTKGRYMYWEMAPDTYQGKTRMKVQSYSLYDAQDALQVDADVPAWVKSKTHGLGPKDKLDGMVTSDSKPATPSQRAMAKKVGLI